MLDLDLCDIDNLKITNMKACVGLLKASVYYLKVALLQSNLLQIILPRHKTGSDAPSRRISNEPIIQKT